MIMEFIHNLKGKRVISVFFIGIIVCSVYLFAAKNKEYTITQENVEMPEEFYSFEGKWIVREYIDSIVELHEVDTDSEEYKRDHEKYTQELKEKYEDCIFEIYEASIDYFYPPTELGYYYINHSILFDIYRQPPTLGIAPPFLCASFRLKESDEEIDIIIDGNDEAVLKVGGGFFKLERVDRIRLKTNSVRKNMNNKTTVIKEFPVPKYEDYYDLTFEELNFIDEDVYEELKQIYAQIDFTCEFEKGDLNSYDFYIEKYQQLVNNEITFYDADKYTYFFFDVDGDSYPELGVTEYIVEKTKRFFYFFKYDAENDRMLMWYYTGSVYSRIMGTRTMGADKDGRYYYFDRLDINGKEEMAIHFAIEAFFTNGNVNYLVTSPRYRDQDNSEFMSKAMKEQGYYTEREERFYFRVTEEQFEELTERYFLAKEKAEKNLENVSYTYVELFGDD